MSYSIKVLFAFTALAALVGCAPPDEEFVVYNTGTLSDE
ncbi:hypothetical protein ROA7450_02578 [Roseovarius albus]|uniref:Uncharacterized protein n=1 Tax=Roseovarius albus TaxID=1247867 RepID=A0A1X6ZHR9_9RHOB|nr:hypothetical protein ROA7450_02578 [Roseovarius albus]